MKKCLISMLTLALGLAFCGSALAGGPGKFGVKAGIVISDETYEYDPNPNDLDFDPNSSTRLTLGVFYEYPLIPHLSIRPGIEYVQKGAEATVVETTPEYPEGLGTRELKDKVEYFSIPVVATVSVPVGVGSTYILAGPRLDVKVGSDMELIPSADMNSTVFGLTFGAGQELPLKGLVAAFVEVSYHHDLGDSFEGEMLTVQNKAFAIAAGVKF